MTCILRRVSAAAHYILYLVLMYTRTVRILHKDFAFDWPEPRGAAGCPFIDYENIRASRRVMGGESHPKTVIIQSRRFTDEFDLVTLSIEAGILLWKSR